MVTKMKRRKPKARIEEISIPEEIMDKINTTFERFKKKNHHTNNISSRYRFNIYKKYIGDLCSCNEIPTKKIIWQYEGIKKVRHLCDDCLSRERYI
jgi:hypothetical protein